MIHWHLQGDLLGLKVCWTLVLRSSLVQTCDEASKGQRDFRLEPGRETREVIEVKEVMEGEEFWCKGKDASRGPVVSSLITCGVWVWSMGTCSSGWFWEACFPHQECFWLNCVWLEQAFGLPSACSWLWGLLGLIFGLICVFLSWWMSPNSVQGWVHWEWLWGKIGLDVQVEQVSELVAASGWMLEELLRGEGCLWCGYALLLQVALHGPGLLYL